MADHQGALDDRDGYPSYDALALMPRTELEELCSHLSALFRIGDVLLGASVIVGYDGLTRTWEHEAAKMHDALATVDGATA